MPGKDLNTPHLFMSRGGEMGTLMRAKDWSKTPVGDVNTWPQSLRTTLSIILNSKFPMFLWWGPELVCFYNDAYRPSLGKNGKHPHILGQTAAEAWPEIWDIIKPLIDQVLTGGEATWSEDQLIPIYRNGKLEDVYWTFSYSPVNDESGNIAGVLVTCNETTEKVLTTKKLGDANERTRLAIDSGLLGTFDQDLRTNKLVTSPRYREIFGFSTEEEITRDQAISVMHPDDLPLRAAAHAEALQNGTLKYEARLIWPDGSIHWISVQGKLFYDNEKTPARLTGIIADTTREKQAVIQLAETERKFRNTVKQAPVGITILRGPQFIVELANQMYLEVVDRTEEAFVGKPLFESMPEVKGAVEPLLTRVLTTGIPYYGVEFPVTLNRYGNSENTYFNFVYQPLREDDGTVTGIIVVANEVTAQVKAKHSITESERQFRKIVTESPIAMTIFRGKDYVIEIANDTLLKNIWRRSLEEVQGKKLFDVFPELLDQKFPELMERVFTTGITYTENEAPAYVDASDGRRLYYLDFEYAPLYEADKTISGIMITVNDVTERVQARKSIEEAEKRFRLLADSVPQHIWTSDAEGNLNYYNQSVFDYSGLTLEKINQDGWLQIVHPEDRPENISRWKDAISNGEHFLFEHRFRRHDGEYRWQLSRALPQRDANGKIRMWVGTSTDIHDQKTFSQELEKKVRERTKDLQNANHALEKMNQELSSFAYVSSHDLQEPLRKIQTFATRIIEREKDNLSEAGKDYFQRMQNAASRMQALIEDLLSYSRTNTKEKIFENKDLNLVVKEVRHELEQAIQEKKALLEVAHLPNLNIIPYQVRQLLTNIISNSLKFAKKDTPALIQIKSGITKGSELKNTYATADENGEYFHLMIRDNGIGFEPEYKERIFEVFQRLHGRDEYSGTGIGLAICKRIVENHHGFITADGQPGIGATFHIYLPVT